MMIHYVLLALAALCFILAAFDVTYSKIKLGWLGLAFFAGAAWFR